MSRYDPQGIFSRPSRYTKTGQIIQKKPFKADYALTHDEIPRSISVLQTFGYSVYSPGQIPSSPSLTIPFLVQFQDISEKYVNFYEIWNSVSSSFTDLLSIPAYNINSAHILVNVTDFNYFITWQSGPPYANTYFILYNTNINLSSPVLTHQGYTAHVGCSFQSPTLLNIYENDSSPSFTTMNISSLNLPLGSIACLDNDTLWFDILNQTPSYNPVLCYFDFSNSDESSYYFSPLTVLGTFTVHLVLNS